MRRILWSKFGLVLLTSTWMCQISYRNGYVGLFTPSFSVSPEPLAHFWNEVILILFSGYYFGRCWSELGELVQLSYSRGRSTRYSDRLHGFSVAIPKRYKDIYEGSFFSGAARPCNSVHAEYFPLTYDLNGCKSKVDRHLLSFWFLLSSCFFQTFPNFLLTSCLAMAVQEKKKRNT